MVKGRANWEDAAHVAELRLRSQLDRFGPLCWVDAGGDHGDGLEV